jgi:hypothetical protein
MVIDMSIIFGVPAGNNTWDICCWSCLDPVGIATTDEVATLSVCGLVVLCQRCADKVAQARPRVKMERGRGAPPGHLTISVDKQVFAISAAGVRDVKDGEYHERHVDNGNPDDLTEFVVVQQGDVAFDEMLGAQDNAGE